MSDVITVGDAAHLMRLTSGRVYQLVKEGKIPGVVRLSRRLVVLDRQTFTDWWSEQEDYQIVARSREGITGVHLSLSLGDGHKEILTSLAAELGYTSKRGLGFDAGEGSISALLTAIATGEVALLPAEALDTILGNL